MGQRLRIAIAEDDLMHATHLSHLVEQSGHTPALVVRSASELRNRTYDNIDALIVSIDLPGGGVESASQLQPTFNGPVIYVGATADERIIESIAESHGAALLLKPIRALELEAAIALAAQHAREFAILRAEAESMKQALIDRKAIEKAKGFLMASKQLSESNAFAFMQKLARQNRQKLADVARSINLTAEALTGTVHS